MCHKHSRSKTDGINVCDLERDSAKDQAVVFIFIFATVGLLIYATVRPWIDQWAEVRNIQFYREILLIKTRKHESVVIIFPCQDSRINNHCGDGSTRILEFWILLNIFDHFLGYPKQKSPSVCKEQINPCNSMPNVQLYAYKRVQAGRRYMIQRRAYS